MPQRRVWTAMLTASALVAFLGSASAVHAQTTQPSIPPATTSTTPAPPETPPPIEISATPPTIVRVVHGAPSILSPKYAARDLARAFAWLDSDQDGNLSRSEAARVTNVARYFDAADTNHDTMLSRQEFDNAMNTTRPQ